MEARFETQKEVVVMVDKKKLLLRCAEIAPGVVHKIDRVCPPHIWKRNEDGNNWLCTLCDKDIYPDPDCDQCAFLAEDVDIEYSSNYSKEERVLEACVELPRNMVRKLIDEKKTRAEADTYVLNLFKEAFPDDFDPLKHSVEVTILHKSFRDGYFASAPPRYHAADSRRASSLVTDEYVKKLIRWYAIPSDEELVLDRFNSSRRTLFNQFRHNRLCLKFSQSVERVVKEISSEEKTLVLRYKEIAPGQCEPDYKCPPHVWVQQCCGDAYYFWYCLVCRLYTEMQPDCEHCGVLYNFPYQIVREYPPGYDSNGVLSCGVSEDSSKNKLNKL